MSMRRRGRDSIPLNRRPRVEERPEIFMMTQEDLADPVRWDDSDRPSFAFDHTASHTHAHTAGTTARGGGEDDDLLLAESVDNDEEDEHNEDSNHSFSWRDIERKSKRRRSSLTLSHDLSEESSAFTANNTFSHTLESTSVDVSESLTEQREREHALIERVLGDEGNTSDETIPLPLETEEAEIPSEAFDNNTHYNNDFLPVEHTHIPTNSETETFTFVDTHTEIATEAHTETQTAARTETHAYLQETAVDSAVSAVDDPEVEFCSPEYFAMLEEMERQALQQQQIQHTQHVQQQHHAETYTLTSTGAHASTEGSSSQRAHAAMSSFLHTDIDLYGDVNDAHATHTTHTQYQHTHNPLRTVPTDHTHFAQSTLYNPHNPQIHDTQYTPFTHDPQQGLLCLRLVAVSVSEDMAQRRKTVCASVHRPQSLKKREGETKIDALTEGSIIVELCGDWYDTHIEAGDIFHAIDIGEGDLCTAHTTFTQQTHSRPTIVRSHTHSHTHVVIDDTHGALSLCPDVLISPTKIAEACTCTRRGFLSDRVRHSSSAASAAVLGNVRHTFIERLTQRVLTILTEIGVTHATEAQVVQRLPLKEMQALVEECVCAYVEELYCVRVSDESVKRDLYALIKPTMTWITVAAKQGVRHLLRKHNVHGEQHALPHTHVEDADYAVTKVVGVEEAILSPVLGLKGQLDLIAGGHTNTHRVSLPVEFKTGRWRASTATAHRAQVILYLLLMTLRRVSLTDAVNDEDNELNASVAQYGVLLYLNEQGLTADCVAPQWCEVRALLLSRNTLARHIHHSTHASLLSATQQNSDTHTDAHTDNFAHNTPHSAVTHFPAMLRAAHECTRCYSAAECVLYHAARENGNESSVGVPLLYNYVLRGITHTHLQYLRRWDALIDCEAAACEQALCGVWSVSGEERERAGERCWGRLSLSGLHTESASEREKAVSECENEFVSDSDESERVCVSESDDTPVYLLLSRETQSQPRTHTMRARDALCFSVGDRVMVSAERLSVRGEREANAHKDVFARALSATHANVCAGTVVAIQAHSVEVRVTQGQKAIASVRALSAISAKEKGWFFRLDKDENNISITTMRSNLMELFVEPFSPKAFSDAQRTLTTHTLSLTRTNTEDSNAPNTSMHNQALHEQSVKGELARQRVRECVVALREPRFRAVPGPLLFALAPNRPVTKRLLAHTNTHSNTNAHTQLPTHTQHPALSHAHNDASLSLSALQQLLNESDLEIMFHLFAPPAMDKKVYQLALKMLIVNTAVALDAQGNEVLNVRVGAPAISAETHTPTHAQFAKSLASHPQLSLLSVHAVDTETLTASEADRVCEKELTLSPSGLTVYPGAHPLSLYREYLQLNVGQREAVHKVLCCEDYMLLWGLPGTGKTYTLSLLVRLLVARQQTVLLTSYTHNAVDHVVEKLCESGVSRTHLMRIHSSSSPAGKAQRPRSVAEYQLRVSRTRVFVATILTVSRHVLFKSHSLHCDVCVVDEAGQITTPVILGGLLRSNKFVLSGDDQQLPPLVLSPQAAKQGLAESLLTQLMHTHPQAVSTLFVQYRMNNEIMSLCNALVYEQRMVCGSEIVAQRRLSLPVETLPLPQHSLYAHIAHQQTASHSSERADWLYRALSESLPVVFLNTDALPTQHNIPTQASSSVENYADAHVVRTLMRALQRLLSRRLSTHSHTYTDERSLDCRNTDTTEQRSVPECAVITPFRAQVALIQRLLSEGEDAEALQQCCEVSTVDKYQGKDRDVVVFCTVKRLSERDASGESERDVVGMLLRDWRRVNVALTRAKQKLIVVGSKTMMQEEPVLKKLSDFMAEREWVIDLPADALQMYSLDKGRDTEHTLISSSSLSMDVGGTTRKRKQDEMCDQRRSGATRVCVEYDLSHSHHPMPLTSSSSSSAAAAAYSTASARTAVMAPSSSSGLQTQKNASSHPHVHLHAHAHVQAQTQAQAHQAQAQTNTQRKLPVYGSRMVPAFTQSQAVRRIPLSQQQDMPQLHQQPSVQPQRQQQVQQSQQQQTAHPPQQHTASHGVPMQRAHPMYGQQMQQGGAWHAHNQQQR